MEYYEGDKVKVIELESTEDGMGIMIGDTGTITYIDKKSDEEIILYVQLDNELIKDYSNANLIEGNIYQFWDYQVELID